MAKRVKSYDEYSKSYRYKILKMLREDNAEHTANHYVQSQQESDAELSDGNSSTNTGIRIDWNKKYIY